MEPAADWDSPVLVPETQERFNAAMQLVDSYFERCAYGATLYSLPYWNVADHVGPYLGIDRSAKP